MKSHNTFVTFKCFGFVCVFLSHFWFLILTCHQIPATSFCLGPGFTSVRWWVGQNNIQAICSSVILLRLSVFYNKEICLDLSALSFPTQFKVTEKEWISGEHGFQKAICLMGHEYHFRVWKHPSNNCSVVVGCKIPTPTHLFLAQERRAQWSRTHNKHSNC